MGGCVSASDVARNARPGITSDCGNKDLDELLRVGIAEAQLASVARTKKRRARHVRNARTMLSAAALRCENPALRAHIMAVLCKLGVNPIAHKQAWRYAVSECSESVLAMEGNSTGSSTEDVTLDVVDQSSTSASMLVAEACSCGTPFVLGAKYCGECGAKYVFAKVAENLPEEVQAVADVADTQSTTEETAASESASEDGEAALWEYREMDAQLLEDTEEEDEGRGNDASPVQTGEQARWRRYLHHDNSGATQVEEGAGIDQITCESAGTDSLVCNLDAEAQDAYEHFAPQRANHPTSPIFSWPQPCAVPHQSKSLHSGAWATAVRPNSQQAQSSCERKACIGGGKENAPHIELSLSNTRTGPKRRRLKQAACSDEFVSEPWPQFTGWQPSQCKGIDSECVNAMRAARSPPMFGQERPAGVPVSTNQKRSREVTDAEQPVAFTEEMQVECSDGSCRSCMGRLPANAEAFRQLVSKREAKQLPASGIGITNPLFHPELAASETSHVSPKDSHSVMQASPSLESLACPSAISSPAVSGADFTPAGAMTSDDALDVRIRNGVNGEEEARFTMHMDACFSEHQFLQMLERLLQHRVGHKLSDLSWLRPQAEGRFERRPCDANMLEELFMEGALRGKGPTVLRLCTVPVTPPSELPSSKIRLHRLVPDRVAPCRRSVPTDLRLETSLLADNRTYSVAFTHQWSNMTYMAEASLLPGRRGVNLVVPPQILSMNSSNTEGLYDVHLVVDHAMRSENRRGFTVSSADSDLSSSSISTTGSFLPIGHRLSAGHAAVAAAR
jgi:hypothetical protein